MKNLKRKSDIDRNKQTSKNRLEARKATVVPDLEISALTKQQKDDTTSKALKLFNEKLLQIRKLNEGRVIVVSIAVTAEGLLPSRKKVGSSIVKEMEQASLWSGTGMANLVRLVSCNGETYYKTYTYRAESVWSSWGTSIQCRRKQAACLAR